MTLRQARIQLVVGAMVGYLLSLSLVVGIWSIFEPGRVPATLIALVDAIFYVPCTLLYYDALVHDFTADQFSGLIKRFGNKTWFMLGSGGLVSLIWEVRTFRKK